MYKVPVLYLRGLLSSQTLYYSAWGLLPEAVGLAAGVAMYSRLDQRRFGRVIRIALLCTGVVYVWRSGWELLAAEGAVEMELT